MSNGNIIVSTLTNRVEWLVDESSYKRALKRIKSLKSAHEKPAKALEAAQKRTAQSEGKAALAAAKAQTAKLRQAKQISAEQQKQAQLSAKVATGQKQRNDVGVMPFLSAIWQLTSPSKRRWALCSVYFTF